MVRLVPVLLVMALATLAACEAPPPPRPAGAWLRLRVVGGSVDDAIARVRAQASAAGLVGVEVERDGAGLRVFIPSARVGLDEARQTFQGAVEVEAVENEPAR